MRIHRIVTILFTLLCTALFAQQKGTLTDTRDGKTYRTVKIGEQVWMAENLNYEAKGSKCYKNATENCDKYGRLYDWYMAMMACPSGWHLSSGKEFGVLKDAAEYLKANSDDWNRSGKGTDAYGFSALPGGYCLPSGNYFDYIGSRGYWWTSDNIGGDYTYHQRMEFNSTTVILVGIEKNTF